jgi:5-histidylcysteine sulfoxide synthase
MIFYYVHPAVLYINKLRLSGLISTPINEYFEKLFETGVDEMSWDDMSKNDIKWPTLDQAWHYRREAYLAICEVINAHPGLAPEHEPILQDDPLWALFMGFEHERIHLETSSVLIRELPVRLVSRPEEWPLDNRNEATESRGTPQVGKDYPHNNFYQVSRKKFRFGKEKAWPTFGWDNEYGSREVEQKSFHANKYLVSNGEFFEFVKSGAYTVKQYWSNDGWGWRSFRNAEHPTFWVRNESGEIYLRTCFEEIPMEWSWPALVNFHEAQAFCNWKSQMHGDRFRQITESEHQSMRLENDFDNNDRNALSLDVPYNINLRYGSESSVNSQEQREKRFGDLFGNVWQWCEDTFNPLEGTLVHPLYADFSSPCYDDQHQMILGGSFISTGDEATPWARVHFRPHFFQQAGFRLARDN